MNTLYKLAVATLYLLFGAFYALIFLAFFEGITYDEARYGLVVMLVLSFVCCAIFEIRNRQSRSS